MEDRERERKRMRERERERERDGGVVEQHGIIIKCIGTLGEILSSLYLHTGDGVRH
ncbi:MAG: hypothetical protein KA053_06010 [Lentimicrobiaceae bacterium]|nr:hypothetical protein [Lentimicrobiaceae bacterium]